MKSFRRARRRMRLCLLLFTAAPLLAQEPEKTPEPPPLARVHFSIYVWPVAGFLHEDSELPPLPRFFYEDSRGIHQVPVERQTTSALMSYTGPLPISFFEVERIVIPPPPDAEPGTPPTVELRKIPLTHVTFPAQWTQALLILLPSGGGDEPMRLLPLQYDFDNIRPGFVRIVNTTGESFAVEVGDQQFRLPAFAPLDFQPPTSKDAKQALRLNFHARDPRTGEVRLRLTTRAVAVDKSSNVYLLYPLGPRRLRLLRVGGHAQPDPDTETN